MGLLKSLLHAVSPEAARRILHRYETLLQDEVLDGCETLLDVGCGRASPVGEFSHRLRASMGVDRHAPYLAESREKRLHSEYRQIDVMEIGDAFAPGSFDCVVALDLIEHLPKDAGLDLLRMMERIARRKVIVFTPTGFLPQTAYDDNSLQEHLSGWEPEEMRRMGYRVIGLNGWRPLRGERGLPRWRPDWLWNKVSLLSQVVAERHPEIAFQMLCVKDVAAQDAVAAA